MANCHPGTRGAAAKLPNSPGSHMLTPPSSASAPVVVETATAAMTDAAARLDPTRDRPTPHLAPRAQRIGPMIAPGVHSLYLQGENPRGSLAGVQPARPSR